VNLPGRPQPKIQSNIVYNNLDPSPTQLPKESNVHPDDTIGFRINAFEAVSRTLNGNAMDNNNNRTPIKGQLMQHQPPQ